MANNLFDSLDLPPELRKYESQIKKLIPLIILFIISWASFFQIEPEEVGVITRFGKYVREVNPGLNFKMPVIEKVYRVPVERQQKQEFGFRTVSAGVNSQFTKTGTIDESLMLTGDLNLADVEWVVQYRIDDPYSYLFKVRNPVSSLRDISEAAMRQVVGDRTVNEVLTVGRTEISNKVLEEIQQGNSNADYLITKNLGHNRILKNQEVINQVVSFIEDYKDSRVQFENAFKYGLI